jgi:FRG domain
MSYPENVVETIHCDTAKEFISTLRITDDRWLPPDAREAPWLFRGHGDSNWPLIPSAWRPSAQHLKTQILGQIINPIERAILKYKRNWPIQDFEQAISKNPYLNEVLFHTIFEIETVRFFSEFVDRLGFPVPQAALIRIGTSFALDWLTMISDTLEYLQSTGWKGKSDYLVWGFQGEPIVALARHHGLPASVLDWTRKPLIAAYFAGYEVLKEETRPESIAVWAIHTSIIHDESPRIRQPRLFRSDLGYLHVQDAVLTYDVGADYHFINHGTWPDIVQAVQDTEHSLKHALLRKITMPTTETNIYDLLRLLWAEGISRPHLMPTFDNISSMLQDEWMRI